MGTSEFVNCPYQLTNKDIKMKSKYDLIVVLVIVVNFAVFAVTGIKKFSREWNDKRCKNNLKNIYSMALIYQNTYNGNIVPGVIKGKLWKWWPVFLIENTKTSKASWFYCPAHPKGQQELKKLENPLIEFNRRPKIVNYGLNFKLSAEYNKKTTRLNISNIADPAYTVYFGDANFLYLWPTKSCWEKNYAPRHFDKSNFVFMDGHVKSMGKQTLGTYNNVKGWKLDRKRWINWLKL
jgi:prepilin-type processing-associated H-X9-DG protein